MRTKKLGPLTENPNFTRFNDSTMVTRSTPFGRERISRAAHVTDPGNVSDPERIVHGPITDSPETLVEQIYDLESLDPEKMEKCTAVRVARVYCSLIKLGEKAVPAIMSTLESDSYWVKDRKLKLLADIGPRAKEAVPVLIRVLENDNDPMLREIAAFALGRIGSAAKEALVPLARIALKYGNDHPNNEHQLVRESARRAIPQIIIGDQT